jgi:hypothetical protein
VRDGKVIGVKEAKIGPIKRFDRSDGRRQQEYIFSMKFEAGGIRLVNGADKIGAVVRDGIDNIRAALAIGKLSDAVDGGITLDSDTNHNHIADHKQLLRAGSIDALTVVGPVLLN